MADSLQCVPFKCFKPNGISGLKSPVLCIYTVNAQNDAFTVYLHCKCTQIYNCKCAHLQSVFSGSGLSPSKVFLFTKDQLKMQNLVYSPSPPPQKETFQENVSTQYASLFSLIVQYEFPLFSTDRLFLS